MKKLGSKFAGFMPVFIWTVVVSAQSTAAFKDLDDAPESHPNPAAPQSTVTPKPQRVEGGLPVNRPPCQPGQVSNCQPSRTNATPYRVKLRAALPLTQFRLVNPGDANGSSVGASLLGASIEAELHQLWAIEMGGAAVGESAPSFPVGADVFVRAGLVPVVYDGRNSDERGWIIQFDALAGYRWLRRERLGGDADSGTEQTHAIRGNLGFDFTRQFSSMAFGVRFLSGLTLPLAQSRTGDWKMHSTNLTPSDDLTWALDLGIDLGIAL